MNVRLEFTWIKRTISTFTVSRMPPRRKWFIEQSASKGLIQEIQSVHHVGSGFRVMENSGHQPQAYELEGLDEGTVGNVVVDGVHLQDVRMRVLVPVCKEILVFPAFEESTVLSFFIGFGKLF